MYAEYLTIRIHNTYNRIPLRAGVKSSEGKNII